MNNPELAYLLGMITGKGTVLRSSATTDILIEIPHKNLEVEGIDAQLSVKASLDDLRNNIEPLIGVSIRTSQERAKTFIKFTKSNEDFLVREINRHFCEKTSWKEFRVPQDIIDASTDIKKEFLIGLSDVTAHVGHGGEAFGKQYAHRVYIEIPSNWFLVVDICNLLTNLDIPVHTIDWGHPNMRDGNLKKYKEGKAIFWNKEHQIKVFAELYEKIGFRVIHKMQILKSLAGENRTEWDRDRQKMASKARTQENREKYLAQIGKIKEIHKKFYWEVNSRFKTSRPIHPMENSDLLPDEIRGQHFNHWTEIANLLGYRQDE